MKTAEEIMTTDVITVSPDTEIAKAAKIMMEKRINGIPVVDSGKLIGILCQSDLIAQQKKFPIPSLFTFLDGYISLTSERHLEKEVQKIAAATVDQAMTPDPVTVSPGTSIEKIAGLMASKPGYSEADRKKSYDARKAEYLKLLSREKSPHAEWALLTEIGFLGWVTCAFIFIFKGFTATGAFQSRPALRWAGGWLVCYGLWIWGLFRV